jgi:hypothetical protein
MAVDVEVELAVAVREGVAEGISEGVRLGSSLMTFPTLARAPRPNRRRSNPAKTRWTIILNSINLQ